MLWSTTWMRSSSHVSMNKITKQQQVMATRNLAQGTVHPSEEGETPGYSPALMNLVSLSFCYVESNIRRVFLSREW